MKKRYYALTYIANISTTYSPYFQFLLKTLYRKHLKFDLKNMFSKQIVKKKKKVLYE